MARVPAEAPGARLAEAVTVTLPPMVPEPPRVAVLFTVTLPVEADELPLTSSVPPLLTVVVPV